VLRQGFLYRSLPRLPQMPLTFCIEELKIDRNPSVCLRQPATFLLPPKVSIAESAQQQSPESPYFRRVFGLVKKRL